MKKDQLEGCPLFSVIIPTLNREFIIGEAIESVLNQSVKDVEIIVIDDGSTDNTKALIAEYGDKVKYIYQENQGISGARNTGLALAKGQFISLLDSDDVFVPGKMKRELMLFSKFPEAEALMGDASLFNFGLHLDKTYMQKRNFEFVKDGGYILDNNDRLWIQGSIFPICSMVMRRSVLDKLGLPLFDTSFPSAEDWDLEIRLINKCKVIIDSAVYSKVRRFEDGTREARNLGVKPREYQATVLAKVLKKRVLEKALLMDNWSAKTLEGLHDKIAEYESIITEHFVANACETST